MWFEAVQAGGPPVVRFYRWNPRCLSLGRNQPARVSLPELEARGIDLVRRPTGGLAVLHDQELTYCVVLPVGWAGSPRATYQAINQSLLGGLLTLGARAHATLQDNVCMARASTTPATFRKGGSCFAGTAPGEIVAGGRKLIGSAQRCERRAILQHGSILLAGDQGIAARLLGAAPDDTATGLQDLIGQVPNWADLVRVFSDALASDLGIGLAPSSLPLEHRARVEELTVHFESPEWTFRV